MCEEKTVGLVRYPATAAPQGEGSVAKRVTAECVENAVPRGPSLEVTCSWDGVWGDEEPQCECIDYYIEEASACTGWYNIRTSIGNWRYTSYAPQNPCYTICNKGTHRT